MNLAERRRALMVQQGDKLTGNLAVLKHHSNSLNITVNSVDGGYSLTTISYTGQYAQYGRFELTTMDITEKLWGKKVQVTADIASTATGAKPLIRFGYLDPAYSWKDFRYIGMDNGVCEIIYDLPSTRPSNMLASIPLMLFTNVQRNETDPLNTLTITNVRLEVVE